MEAWAFFHGFLGVVLVMGLAVTLWETLSPARKSGPGALKIAVIALTALVTLKNLLGDYIYITYRSQSPTSPRSIILAGSRPWVHEILMEFKEHAAQFLPPLLLVVIAVLFAYNIFESKNSGPRKVVAALLSLSLAITLVVMAMGAFIATNAPMR